MHVPGGARTFISLAELEVHCAGTAGDRLAGSATGVQVSQSDGGGPSTPRAWHDHFAAGTGRPLPSRAATL